MEQLLWFFATSESVDFLSPILRPLVICLVLYQLDGGFLLARHLYRRAFGASGVGDLAPENRLEAIMVLPTLIRNRSELEGLQHAITSVAGNGYPGRLTIVASIDDRTEQPELYTELQQWAASFDAAEGVRIIVTGTPERRGKAVAIDHAVQLVEHLVARGELGSFPKVFFNMDADSTLAPRTLERMVYQLTKRSRFTGERPMIVASNVCVAKHHYWDGWQSLLSLKGWLALSVAREYLTSISLAKHNSKLIPVTGVSGALYCTWSHFHRVGPRYAAFMQTLRLRDWLSWWLGAPPPRFSESKVDPLPEAMTGPGDDTWMTWLACSGTWREDDICLDFPRTPWHAAGRFVRSYFFRKLAYDPAAKVYTASPTTLGGLFKQRIRWNSSRAQDMHRWRMSHMFHWEIGLPVLAGILVLVITNGMILVSMLLLPFVPSEPNFLAMFVLTNLAYIVLRTYGTVLSMILDGDVRGQWHKLLALPISSAFHFVFNILTTIAGFVQDIFLFGTHTNFAPERTLKKSRITRIALGYRVRRALLLAVRSVVHNDVPLGAFWFGWRESPWTPSGFQGWTGEPKKAQVHAADGSSTTPAFAPAQGDLLGPASGYSMAEAGRPTGG